MTIKSKKVIKTKNRKPKINYYITTLNFSKPEYEKRFLDEFSKIVRTLESITGINEDIRIER